MILNLSLSKEKNRNNDMRGVLTMSIMKPKMTNHSSENIFVFSTGKSDDDHHTIADKLTSDVDRFDNNTLK